MKVNSRPQSRLQSECEWGRETRARESVVSVQEEKGERSWALGEMSGEVDE